MKFIKYGLVVVVLVTAATVESWRWWSADNDDFRTEITGTWSFDKYQLMLSSGVLSIIDEETAKTVFRNKYKERLIDIAPLTAELIENRGMVDVDQDLTWASCNQVLQDVVANRASEISVKGKLVCSDETYHFSLRFSGGDDFLDVELSTGFPSKLALHSVLDSRHSAVGFGAQFSRINMRGLLLPVIVSEQGIGRGRQPLTAMVDWVANAGGDWSKSYAPVPWFFTDVGTGYWLQSDSPSWFDFRSSDRFIVTTLGQQMTLRVYQSATPKGLIELFTADTGRMKAPPNWVNEGLILGVQGGEQAWDKYQTMTDNSVKISALWLQDWVGQRTTSFGQQLQWNWQLDSEHYPNWHKQSGILNEQGVKLLGYLNPFLVPAKIQGDELWRIAVDNELFVSNQGEPIEFRNTSFSARLIDLYAEDALDAYRSQLVANIQAYGFSGWMADFAEAYPGQEDTLADHNRYAVEWAKFNQLLVEDLAIEDALVWHRSGYIGSANYVDAFWLGDQLVSWDEHDGIKSAVTGLLSASMSGMSVNHSDIGGYTTLDHPLGTYVRSEELLLRWLELNALGLILRSHEGNLPQLNAQLFDVEVAPKVASMVDLFVALAPYRTRLYQEMEATGVPPIRHPLVEYPSVERYWALRYQQYFLGADLLVVPVLDEGAEFVDAILPPGEWVHFWSNDVYLGHEEGNVVRVRSPLGEPAFFVRKDSAVQSELKGAVAVGAE